MQPVKGVFNSCVLPQIAAEDLGAQERKDVPRVQEYKYTEVGQWMLVTALAVRYLSGHREQSCFVQRCSSTSSPHNLFSPKIYSRKNMQSFLVLKWIWECFCRCLCC